MAERDCSGVRSARRRREQRLRSWWRHERMTVAAELAVALHHSRGVGPAVPHEALRGQTPASLVGRRPGVLKEPVPPVVVEHAACPWSGAPLLAIPCLGGGADGVDVTTTRFLLKKALLRKKEDEKEKAEHEEKILELNRRVQADLPLSATEHLAWRQWIGIAPAASSSSSGGKRRKRKKRRKRRTPRTSSRSLLGRRRQRQWRVRLAGFAGSNAPRDVFPVADDWPLLLDNTVGMDQKDSIFVVVMAVAYARLVFLVSLVPLCSLLSSSGPDAPHHGRYQPEGLLFSGMVLLVILHLALCFLPCCQALDACRQARRQVCIMAGMDQKEGYVVPCRKLREIRSCSSSTRSSSSSSCCLG